MSLSTRIIVLIISVTALLGAVAIPLSSLIYRDEIRRLDSDWAATLASSLAETIAYDTINRNAIHARQILGKIIEEHEKLDYAYIVDFDKQVFAHTFEGGFPEKLLAFTLPQAGLRHSQRIVLDGKHIEDVGYPIIEGMPARFHLGINHERECMLIRDTNIRLMLIFLSTGALGVAISSLISRRIVKPLDKLSAHMAEYASGRTAIDFRPQTKSPEILQLARGFTEMVNARSLVEQALHKSKAMLTEAQRLAHIGSWELDLIANELVWSEEVYRIFEMDAEKFNASYEAFLDTVHPDDRVIVDKAYTDSVKNNTPYDIVHRLLMKAGSIKYVNERCETFYDDNGNPIRSIGTVQDVTERVRAEAALRRAHDELEQKVAKRTQDLAAANERLKGLDRLKSMFIASMSHELRTPLNSIIGFTGVMLQEINGQLNERQRDHLARVYRAARHLLALISDVIDISKIEAGKIAAYPQTFALDELIDEAAGTIRPEAKAKGLAFEVHTPPGLQLYTDRKRLLQCLLNFLSNAVKFTEKGKIIATAHEADNEIEIKVTDTGIGIAKDDLPELFQPFARLESALEAKTLGTGLGLYLSRKLATEVLAGEVAVQSKSGCGSTFSVRVPKVLDVDRASNMNATSGNRP